jgi:hypothetical protein
MLTWISGGLGLTGGIADVGSLYDAFVAMKDGKADESILDKYSEIRIKKWQEIINPMSRANFKRVCRDEPDEEAQKFWDLCKKMDSDDELARQMSTVGSYIVLTDVVHVALCTRTDRPREHMR